MNFTCHPSYDFGEGSDIFACDNYFIAGDMPERLHKTPREIQALGN
jgi:hypothetical protein